MSALDTAKELGRMATTATLGKDVIDLFKEKVALLENQVAALEKENSSLKSENSELEKKNENLQQELERIRPKPSGLDEIAKKFIKILFERGSSLDFDNAAQQIGVSKGMAAYYIDVLRSAGMIVGVGVVLDDNLGAYDLTPKGREFAVKSGLA